MYFCKNGKLEFNQYVELFKPYSKYIANCMRANDKFIFTYEERK